ncbi:MAG TPA: large conductance mechanosensitive channel protein MscL [Solirubrobacteraceae bacterium]|jgi:large conductance mechanosensitive channel|nr:large conductance mechanosensitive channel protein MscL [Solirubrobacteraceae bacterium]
MLREFRNFILRGNAIDLAVAVVIGAAFGAVVNSLVTDIFTPIIAIIFGEPNFDALTLTINDAVIAYGSFLNAVFTLLAVGAAVFFLVVKPVNYVMERRKAGEEPPPAAVPEDIVLLGEIRDLLKARG